MNIEGGLPSGKADPQLICIIKMQSIGAAVTAKKYGLLAPTY